MQIVGTNTGIGYAATNKTTASLNDAAKAQSTSLSSLESLSVTIDIRSINKAGDEAEQKDKKQFKSMKELVGYMLMLMTRWMQEKPGPGEGAVKMEDRVNFEKLRADMNSVTSGHTTIV